MENELTLDTTKEAQRPTQLESAYVPLSVEAGKACANCRFFSGSSSMCTLIQNYPDDVMPTGYCTRWEARNIPQPVTEDQVAAVADGILQAAQIVTNIAGQQYREHTEHEAPVEGFIAPDSASDGVFKSLVAKFKRGMKPGLSVLKGADGKRYMFVITSNSYQDREGETITTPALKEWVDSCWKSVEDQFTTDNPLVFWHDMRVKMGDIVWSDVRGPFLVELAKEDNTPLARKMFDYIEANPDEKWGASHKFAYFKSQRDTDGTYHKIYKRETTVLPRQAAANALTFSGVIPMASKRDEYLNKMLGIENASELLDKGIEPLVAELNKRGIEHKSTEKPAGDTTESKGYETLLVEIIKAQAELGDELDTVKTALQVSTDKVAELEKASTALVTENKSLSERVALAEVAAKAAPRSASRAGETEVETGKISDDLKKSMHKRDPFFNAEVKE